MEQNINSSLRIFLADTASITIGFICLLLIFSLFFILNQIKNRMARYERQAKEFEKEVREELEKNEQDML